MAFGPDQLMNSAFLRVIIEMYLLICSRHVEGLTVQLEYYDSSVHSHTHQKQL